MTSSSRSLSLAQLCLLATFLAGLVYYLEAGRIAAENDAPFLGGPLRPASGKMHILVTGGAGYIGSHAAKHLLEAGHAITVIDNLSRGNIGAIEVLRKIAPHKRFQFVQMDLGHGEQLKDVFQRCSFSAVIHFAAVAYVGESVAEPLRYYHNITANVVNVLEAMSHASVKELIYSSTCATYGNPAVLPVTEDTPTVPINPYGRAKLAAEGIIRDAAAADTSLRAVIFRYFNVYGSDPGGALGEFPPPALRQHSRISGACMDAAMHETTSLKITGTRHPTPDGTCVRDYIHVTDLVAAHALGLRHLANPPELFNVATGRGVSVREFVDACRAATGADISVVEQPEARPGDYAEIWADPAKIERVMKWQAKYTDVQESLRHAWDWRRRHPHGYPPRQPDHPPPPPRNSRPPMMWRRSTARHALPRPEQRISISTTASTHALCPGYGDLCGVTGHRGTKRARLAEHGSA
eukprot:jgi/Ulvmu1/9750/UM055_0090.1